ncbi:hypothetical protein E2C01_071836 [Portunus trituberculatus]|uniref:Uncharacterized protein n=1 Tax=Portunus trituberculatus TaxID=210409 RepID=A0A5B7I9H9_PORTR|nr:hypothetical protein [Portunus trituberculatus]
MKLRNSKEDEKEQEVDDVRSREYNVQINNGRTYRVMNNMVLDRRQYPRRD